MVYEIQYLTTGDIITEYEDPTPGTLPATATGSLTLPSSAQLSVNNALVVKSGATWTVSTFDEVRLSTSYGVHVAPDPKANRRQRQFRRFTQSVIHPSPVHSWPWLLRPVI